MADGRMAICRPGVQWIRGFSQQAMNNDCSLGEKSAHTYVFSMNV